jgi:hypothetical protein
MHVITIITEDVKYHQMLLMAGNVYSDWIINTVFILDFHRPVEIAFSV